MRTLVLLPLLLAIPALPPLPTYGAERSWTIARDVYTAEAELVAVRGNLAFLKIDGRVDEIPIERLSALDQQYIASLSLAPILPGPAADLPGPAAVTAVAPEEMPLPGEPDAPVAENELNAPDLAPAYGGTPIPQQPLPRSAYRVDESGRLIPLQPGVAANYVAPFGEPRAGEVGGLFGCVHHDRQTAEKDARARQRRVVRKGHVVGKPMPVFGSCFDGQARTV